jgi:hypothetical protein
MAGNLAGFPVTVTDATATTVTTGTLDGNARFSATLPVGDYIASAEYASRTYRSGGVVDQGDADRLSPEGVADTSRKSLAAFAALRAALVDGSRSCGIQVLGDSTGNDTFEWPYKLAESIAERYPAWTVQHRLWSDATQQYAAPTTIQTGTAGARYLDCSTGSTTRRLDTSVTTHPTSGVLDVRVKVSLTDWTPAANVNFCGRSASDPNRSWYCGLFAGSGNPFFSFTPNGLGASMVTKNLGVTTGFVDGSTNWLRYVFIPDNGASGYDFKVYTSADGVTWTQLGSTVTTAGATALYNNTATAYEVGGVAGAVNSTLKVYEVQIRDGVDGPNLVPALPDLWPRNNSSGVLVAGAPVLTIVNGSHTGAPISYLGDATRLPKMTPDYGQLVTFLSDQHNETTWQGPAWIAKYDTWRQQVEAQVPGSPVIILTQNPKTNADTWYREGAARRLDLIAYARSKSIDYIDTYQAFLDAGWPGNLMADAIHPNAAGQLVWRDAILNRFLIS